MVYIAVYQVKNYLTSIFSSYYQYMGNKIMIRFLPQAPRRIQKSTKTIVITPCDECHVRW